MKLRELLDQLEIDYLDEVSPELDFDVNLQVKHDEVSLDRLEVDHQNNIITLRA